MKHQIQAKSKTDTSARQQNSPGANAASIAPPSYGMDFLDSRAKQPNRTGLPDNLKSGIENLSGLSMDSVRVHYNSPKPAQLNALAYAQGTDIHVASGQEKHLPHEAWHVVQQKQGRVRPTMQMKGGVSVNDEKGLEKDADVMGEKALQNTDGSKFAKPVPIAAKTDSVVQMVTAAYAKLVNSAAFSAKHLHANASQNLCSAMLIARKYRNWKSSTDKHSLISSTAYPAAWKVPNIAVGNKTTSKLSSIDRQYIASDPVQVTANKEWTVKSKTTVVNPSVAGNVSALAPAENLSNGSGNVNCSWQIAVNHLAGADDEGLNPTTVEWDANKSEYKVTRSDTVSTFAKAVVEQ